MSRGNTRLINLINIQQFEAADSVRAVLESRAASLPPVQRLLQLPVGSAVLAGDRWGCTRIQQEKTPGAVGIFILAHIKTSLSDQSRLLIPQGPANRNLFLKRPVFRSHTPRVRVGGRHTTG